MVVSLFLTCKSSYRDLICFFETVFDYSISIGHINSIINETSEKANIINKSYTLESIKTSAADEVFQRNKSILAVVDIESRFCPLLVKAEKRDYETWGIHLMDINEQGYAPDTTIIDSAMGISAINMLKHDGYKTEP